MRYISRNHMLFFLTQARCLLLFLFVLFGLKGCTYKAHPKDEWYFSDAPWSQIRLARTGETPAPQDTMVLMCSNRVFHPERKKILGDEMDSVGASRLFLLVSKQGEWILYPLKSIEEGMRYQRKRNLVVYVEGMGKNFVLAAERASEISKQNDVSVVMMDYPSIHPGLGMHANFKYARHNASQSAPQLVSLLQELQRNKQQGKEWTTVKWTLFLHSMGNILLERIAKEQLDSVLSPGLFDIVALNAPCVNQRNHHLWLEHLALGKTILVHYNHQDKQLNGAMLLLFHRQLGARPHFPLARNAHYVDFNPILGSLHSAFVEIPRRPPIPLRSKQYFRRLFHGQVPDFSDSTQFGKGWKGIGVSLK